jgi:protein O-GlcNAcase/histone acetyltransferase
LPDVPTVNFYTIRPFSNLDEREVYSICHKTCFDGSDCTSLFPENLQEIPADRLIAPFVTLHPEFCMVVENSDGVLVGYACAALDAKLFYRNQEVSFNASNFT